MILTVWCLILREWMCTHVGAGCGVWGGRFLCRSTACGWMGPAASCSSPSLSPSSPPGWCKSEEGTSLSAAKAHEWISHLICRQEDGNMLSFTLSHSHSSPLLVTSMENTRSVSPWHWWATPRGSSGASPWLCSALWCSICPKQCHDKLWGPEY